MEFRNFGFLREVKIFLMSVVGLSYEGVGEGSIFLWGRSVHSTSIFPF